MIEGFFLGVIAGAIALRLYMSYEAFQTRKRLLKILSQMEEDGRIEGFYEMDIDEEDDRGK